MKTIGDGVTKLMLAIEQRVEDVFNVCTRELEKSVKEGSPITGTKGIPVDTGTAKNSVIAEKTGTLSWKITATGKGKNDTTGKEEDATYIVHIEENVRGVQFNNGGPHFFRDTIANFDKIVASAVAEVAT